MNCNSVQELLPLYVSRDLDEDRVQLITAHVHSCAICATSAQEHNETRDLLQEFAPPAFSDAVYSGIRENVWREIDRQAESRPRLLTQLIAGMFRPRVSWAVATALILAVALVAFYFIANRRSNDQQIAGSPLPVAPRKADVIATRSPQHVATIRPVHRTQVRKRTVTGADRAPVIAETRNQQPSGITEAALNSNKLAEPGAVQSSEKVFRLEMQTKDPNIRIIWLTPPRTKHDSPGKISKGV